MSIARIFSVGRAEYDNLNRQLIFYFSHRCPPGDRPSDLAGDTWVAIVKQFKGECSLRHFAFSVARRLVCNEWRKSRLTTIPYDDEVLWLSPGPGPDSLIMLAARQEAMGRALEHVTNVYRDVLELWLVGWDDVQIAAELDIPYNTVRSRLCRGKAQVNAALVDLKNSKTA